MRKILNLFSYFYDFGFVSFGIVFWIMLFYFDIKGIKVFENPQLYPKDVDLPFIVVMLLAVGICFVENLIIYLSSKLIKGKGSLIENVNLIINVNAVAIFLIIINILIKFAYISNKLLIVLFMFLSLFLYCLFAILILPKGIKNIHQLNNNDGYKATLISIVFLNLFYIVFFSNDLLVKVVKLLLAA